MKLELEQAVQIAPADWISQAGIKPLRVRRPVRGHCSRIPEPLGTAEPRGSASTPYTFLSPQRCIIFYEVCSEGIKLFVKGERYPKEEKKRARETWIHLLRKLPMKNIHFQVKLSRHSISLAWPFVISFRERWSSQFEKLRQSSFQASIFQFHRSC